MEEKRLLETGLRQPKNCNFVHSDAWFFSGGSCTTLGDGDCTLANQRCVDAAGVASPAAGGGATDVCACDDKFAANAAGTCVPDLGKQQQ